MADERRDSAVPKNRPPYFVVLCTARKGSRLHKDENGGSQLGQRKAAAVCMFLRFFRLSVLIRHSICLCVSMIILAQYHRRAEHSIVDR
jgi:hypothetical protein